MRYAGHHIKLIFAAIFTICSPRLFCQNEIPNSVIAYGIELFGEETWNQFEASGMRHSLTGTHYDWNQYIEGKRVHESFVKFHVVGDNVVETSQKITSAPVVLREFPEIDMESMLFINSSDSIVNEEQVWVEKDNELIPSLQITVVGGYDRAMDYFIDHAYNVLDSIDRVCFLFTPVDSTANAMVFLPDPLTSSGNTYGGSYVDSGDMNINVLNAERVSVQIPVTYDSGYFHLKNDYVLITNHNYPNYVPAKKASGNFDFERADQGFEDVNVYYHINVFQQHLQDLGFTNLVNYQIHAESHATQNDNSTFVSTYSPPRLSFGEGGVDDGEDADVIIHEYGHAISYSASPGSNTGMERRSLDEGIGDYLAASYSRSINPFSWDAVFTWDGHNEFFSGRTASSTKHYPDDLAGSDIHANGEIWSSALMELWSDIGGDITDRILLESMYNYFSDMNMNDAARLFVMADSLLYNGIHMPSICDVFNNRGFSTSCNNYSAIDELQMDNGIFVKGSFEFLSGGDALIYTNQDKLRLIEVYNGLGQLVNRNSINSKEFRLSSENLERGNYFIRVYLNNNVQSTIHLVKN